MKPVFSATPTPSSATSTTPRGGNPVNVGTRLTMNAVSAVPVNWFAMRSGSPVRGCASVNSIGASSADATHVSSSRSRNRMAGSGSRLPTASTPLRKRSMAPPRRSLSGRSSRSACVAAMRFFLRAPAPDLSPTVNDCPQLRAESDDAIRETPARLPRACTARPRNRRHHPTSRLTDRNESTASVGGRGDAVSGGGAPHPGGLLVTAQQTNRGTVMDRAYGCTAGAQLACEPAVVGQ